MRFHEVQPALENGETVRRKDMLPGHYIKAIKVNYPNNSCNFFLYKCRIVDNEERSERVNFNQELFDDDWEFVEHLIEDKLQEHKKWLEVWISEINEKMEREKKTERPITYQELFIWSIRKDILEQCVKHISDLEEEEE